MGISWGNFRRKFYFILMPCSVIHGKGRWEDERESEAEWQLKSDDRDNMLIICGQDEKAVYL